MGERAAQNNAQLGFDAVGFKVDGLPPDDLVVLRGHSRLNERGKLAKKSGPAQTTLGERKTMHENHGIRRAAVPGVDTDRRDING